MVVRPKGRSPEAGMPITVAELVAMPHLGLAVIAGQRGLNAKATWAHVCELEDPVPWLEGGEVLLTTGMAIPAGRDRQVAYLRRLIGRQVAALAISAHMHAPSLHPDMVGQADAGGLPVLSVSIEVPFLAISRWLRRPTRIRPATACSPTCGS